METTISQSVFVAAAAFWGICSIALLISAARLCYRIEARSGRPFLKHSLKHGLGLPGYANVIPVAFNFRVARDAETQALRWRMNGRLLAILAGFGVVHLLRLAAGA